jgi:hypothetical protein
MLQDVRLRYSQQLSPSLWLNAGAGLTSNTGNAGNGTGLALDVELTKTFHRMDFALGYNRGNQFNGLITGAASDRADLAHTIYWTRRLSTVSSVAYFRTSEVSTQSQSGLYGTEQASYGLTRNLSLSGSFSYSKQVGDGVYVLSGHHRYLTVGVVWAVAPSQHY